MDCVICGIDIGIKNLAFCIIEATQNIHDKEFTIVNWNSIDLTMDNEKLEPQDMAVRIFKSFDKYSDSFKKVTEVYIENQPSLKNPTMKSIANYVMSYFVATLKLNNPSIIIKFVSPANKIKLSEKFINYIDHEISEHNLIKKIKCKCVTCKLSNELTNNTQKFGDKYSKYKFPYSCTKLLGILYTQYILEKYDAKSLDTLKVYKKQDDLCDAFLHAYNKI
jgi:hypothetical protein